jgi:hypothetical protein
MTAERHKGYNYYHCSFGRGWHKCKYIPEWRASEMLGEVLKSLSDSIPADVVHGIAQAIQSDRNAAEEMQNRDRDRLMARLAAMKERMKKAYEDKLAGNIDESFWLENMNDWRNQKQEIELALERASVPLPDDSGLTVQKILELAQGAHSLYVMRSFAEQGKLLKMILSNCVTDGVNIWPTYRKPFDVIFERAKNKEWRRERDSNLSRFAGVRARRRNPERSEEPENLAEREGFELEPLCGRRSPQAKSRAQRGTSEKSWRRERDSNPR